jgi:peptide/nickel transport system ATP-binding protein
MTLSFLHGKGRMSHWDLMTTHAPSTAARPKLGAVPPGDPRDRGGRAQPMLIANGLTKHFAIRGGVLNRQVASVRAVDGVSFCVLKGETLGIVGESGCGKSTLARLLMHLIEKDSGELIFDGEGIGESHGLSLRELRRNMQMVFQDSYSSLNPRLPVQDSIAYGPRVHGMPRAEARAVARELLEKVGLEPDLFGARYPHELSGGQKQRVNVARALALHPRVLILDEAVSALDKSVSAQVLNLLRHLKRHFNLTYIFISHDLDVVQYISDRVLVMYLGHIVEIGPVEAIYRQPRHPYTRALIDSRLTMDPDDRIDDPPLTGDPPNPIDPPSGCRFRTRCAFAENVCAARAPVLDAWVDRDTHLAACHMEDPASGHSRAGRSPLAATNAPVAGATGAA